MSASLVIAGKGVVKVRLRHIRPAPHPAAGPSIAADESFHILCRLVATVAGA